MLDAKTNDSIFKTLSMTAESCARTRVSISDTNRLVAGSLALCVSSRAAISRADLLLSGLRSVLKVL